MFDSLIFDLDGTISDPISGIHRSINFALEDLGFPTITQETASAFIGPPIDGTFAKLINNNSRDVITQLVMKYRERYNDIGYSENLLYPDVIDSILYLKEAGVMLGICTSKKTEFAEKILKLFGIRIYFDFVSGGDVGVKKEHQLKELLNKKIISKNSLMIGDRDVDIVAARMNDLPSAGVLWGYGSKEELEGENPSLILAKPLELKSLARNSHKK